MNLVVNFRCKFDSLSLIKPLNYAVWQPYIQLNFTNLLIQMLQMMKF
jgi:hypothetical protein